MNPAEMNRENYPLNERKKEDAAPELFIENLINEIGLRGSDATPNNCFSGTNQLFDEPMVFENDEPIVIEDAPEDEPAKKKRPPLTGAERQRRYRQKKKRVQMAANDRTEQLLFAIMSKQDSQTRMLERVTDILNAAVVQPYEQ